MKNPDIRKKLEAFDKVVRVIESCRTLAHINNADNMVENFIHLYREDVYSRELDTLWFEQLQMISYMEEKV